MTTETYVAVGNSSQDIVEFEGPPGLTGIELSVYASKELAGKLRFQAGGFTTMTLEEFERIEK